MEIIRQIQLNLGYTLEKLENLIEKMLMVIIKNLKNSTLSMKII